MMSSEISYYRRLNQIFMSSAFFLQQKKQVQSYLKQEVTESDREIPDVFKVDDYLVSELDASENTKDSFREERAT